MASAWWPSPTAPPPVRCWTTTYRPARAASLDRYLAVLPKADRDDAKAIWQAVYASYPGRLHAVGMGTDKSDAVIGQALETLASQIWNTPEPEIAEAISAIKTGTAASPPTGSRPPCRSIPARCSAISVTNTYWSTACIRA